MQAVSTGKRVTPQARDLLWFQKLHEHGPLPTSFLLHYARDTHRSEKRAKERLTDLFNEENTPHGGAYLTRPLQQFRTLDSRYKQLVYDLSPASEKALQENALASSSAMNRSGPWLHRFMVSCITASIETATLDRDELVYIPQSHLLERANADLACAVPIKDSVGGKCTTKNLIPDALFGLEYKSENGSRFRCFVVEADRSTEPVNSKNFNRKSWQRSLLQYNQYIGRKMHQAHLSLKSPLLVLTVVKDQKRLEQIQSMVPNYAESIRSQILLQSWEVFGDVFCPPDPNDHLLKVGWTRSGLSSFRIDRI